MLIATLFRTAAELAAVSVFVAGVVLVSAGLGG